MKAAGKKNKRLSFDDRHSTLAYMDQKKNITFHNPSNATYKHLEHYMSATE